MSTARTRFGVSILVGLALAVLCTMESPARAAQPGARPAAFSPSQKSIVDIDYIMNATSSRAQIAVGVGAGVPMLLIGLMVRRRNQADC